MTYELFIESMTILTFQLVFGVLWIWAVFCVFSDGYIFGNVGNLIKAKLPGFIYKPLIGCPPCMSSIHGFIIASIFYNLTDWQFYLLIISLCGLNFIIKTWLYPEYE